MSRLDDLIAKAKEKKIASIEKSRVLQKDIPAKPVHKTKIESIETSETNLFDNLDDYMDGLQSGQALTATDFAPDGLQVGDPVVGIHKGQRLSGQVIDVHGEYATVEWKNHDVSEVKTDALELSNVDDDYTEETMYIESVEPTMGFDKESFVEDTDLQSLLSAPDQSSFKYGVSDDL